MKVSNMACVNSAPSLFLLQRLVAKTWLDPPTKVASRSWWQQKLCSAVQYWIHQAAINCLHCFLLGYCMSPFTPEHYQNWTNIPSFTSLILQNFRQSHESGYSLTPHSCKKHRNMVILDLNFSIGATFSTSQYFCGFQHFQAHLSPSHGPSQEIQIVFVMFAKLLGGLGSSLRRINCGFRDRFCWSHAWKLFNWHNFCGTTQVR